MGFHPRKARPDFDGFSLEDWLRWFAGQARSDRRDRIYYDERPLSASEAALIGPSIAQFQLGEMSDGACLVKALTVHALRTSEEALIPLARLLVQEERHHAFLLAEFMTHHRLRKVRFHPLDAAFRILRRMGGVETMLSTLLIAELIATQYYHCLGAATRSVMLKRIAGELMEDEIAHIHFYRFLLGRLRKRRSPFHNGIIRLIEYGVFIAALLAVWPFHHKVYRRAGTGKRAYLAVYWRLFREAISDPTKDRDRRLEAAFAASAGADLA